MTVLRVTVARDASGRLHGTIARDAREAAPVPFTGVIEMVARVEAALDGFNPDPDPDPDEQAPAAGEERP